jgi:hypothetical protein
MMYDACSHRDTAFLGLAQQAQWPDIYLLDMRFKKDGRRHGVLVRRT